MVVRSVVFYEQSLVEAMRTAIIQEVSEEPQFSFFSTRKHNTSFDSNELHTQFLESESKIRQHSLADLDTQAQPKFPGIEGRHSLLSKKSTLITPANAPSTCIRTPQLSDNDKRAKGKYSRLKRELPLALQTGEDRVCMVTVEDEDHEYVTVDPNQEATLTDIPQQSLKQ